MISILWNIIFIFTSIIGNIFSNVNTNNISKPLITPLSGSYPEPLLVSITCETPNVAIYYTTTGNTPVIGTSFTSVYTTPFTILETTTVKAIAVSESSLRSLITTSIIQIENPGICRRPIFSNPSGEYSGSLTLSMTTPTVDSEIWYTTNGNKPRIDIPNSFTKLYQSPISIFENTNVKAITVKDGLVDSPITSSNYTIVDPRIVSNPIFNLPSNQYTGPQIISLTSLTEGATIYYTTNGNVPNFTTANTFTKLYTEPFTLSTNTTVRAIAIKSGWRQSAVSVNTYYFCNF